MCIHLHENDRKQMGNYLYCICHSMFAKGGNEVTSSFVFVVGGVGRGQKFSLANNLHYDILI